MSNKLIYLMCFVLVLGLAGVSPAGLDDDPNLVAWWPMDGDANDVSGNGLNGSLVGDAHFVAGYIGQAIALDGDGDYVNIDGWQGLLGAPAISAGAWVNTTSTATADTGANSTNSILEWGPNVSGQRFGWRINAGRLRFEHHGGNVQGNTVLADGEWHNVGITIEAGATVSYPQVILWLDGRDDTIPTTDADPVFNLTAAGDARIGSRLASNDRFFDGMIDELRLYDRVLTKGEMRLLAGLLKSYDPSPANGALVEATSALLQWTPGPTSTEFDVYFGTNPAPGPDELVARQSESAYMAMNLVEGQMYYWRVDDVEEDGTVHVGDVWSFWVAPKRAYDPSPSDGAINLVDLETDLSWTGGWTPVMHAVYFGTDADAVASATGAPPLMDTTYDPGPLESGTTYYWRVDEFYGTEWVTGPVWSFSTVPVIEPADDPNLLTYWPLDEMGGRTAVDMSGHAHHGIFIGDPQWVDGLAGGGLEFDGADDEVEHLLPEATTFPTFSIALWARAAFVGEPQYASTFSGHTPNTSGIQIDVDGSNPGLYRINPPGGTTLVFGPVVADWVHLTLVGEGTSLQFYYNGDLAMTGDVTDNDVLVNQFVLGASRNRGTHFAGTIDDFRFYDRALNADEVKQLTRFDLNQAWDPQPAIGSSGDIWRMAQLSWMSGDGAAEHDVYLGTDKAAVEAADASDTTGIYRGRQAETTYMSSLAWITTYYWRIDEVAADGAISTGRVWSFATTDEIVLYDEVTPFPYDNSVEPFVSEITLDIDPAQDWTGGCGGGGIGSVAIAYDGQAAPGSITVDEAAGTTTVVGRGADIWGASDQFQFAHTTLVGDGSMIVKVDSLDATDPWTKAGIMIRESLDPGSAFAAVYATGENGVRFQARTMADQDAISDSAVATAEQMALTAPVWLKIERTFPMISAYYSSDGVTWTPMSWNPQVIPMTPLPIYIGLAVTSHSGDSTYAEAVFSSLSSTGGVAAGPLTSTEIGLESNAPEPMYLVLEDASGGMAAALNPDPAATQLTGAEWIVDLDEFDIDRTAVVSATLVIGDMYNTPVGGAGMLTINSVRLLPDCMPVAYWKLDEGAGTVATDSSGNGNDGTLDGGPTVVDGQFGLALAFDNSRVEIPASDTLTGDLFQGTFTLSAWINPTRAGNTWQQVFRSLIASDRTNDTLFINKDGRLSWRGRVGGAWAGGMCETASDVVPADQWTHAAVTGDGTSFRIYINGVLSQESAFKTTDGGNTMYYIGGDPGAPGESYAGAADDVRIYDQALSEAEIMEIAGL
jgi:hypothetical protein